MAGVIRFSKSNRLRKPQEFRAVYKSSRRSGDDILLVITRKNSRNIARLGMSVPKKRLNRSVRRNAVKRVFRESFRTAQELLKGLDVVVVFKGAGGDIDNKLFFSKLKRHWKKVSICKKSC